VSTATSAVSEQFDVEKVRADFPALHQRVHGQPLVYLDSAATAQKPLSVIRPSAAIMNPIAPIFTAACMN